MTNMKVTEGLEYLTQHKFCSLYEITELQCERGNDN